MAQSFSAVVLWDRPAGNERELSIVQGEHLIEVEMLKDKPGWAKGTNKHGVTGYFPANYVRREDQNQDGGAAAGMRGTDKATAKATATDTDTAKDTAKATDTAPAKATNTATATAADTATATAAAADTDTATGVGIGPGLAGLDEENTEPDKGADKNYGRPAVVKNPASAESVGSCGADDLAGRRRAEHDLARRRRPHVDDGETSAEDISRMPQATTSPPDLGGAKLSGQGVVNHIKIECRIENVIIGRDNVTVDQRRTTETNDTTNIEANTTKLETNATTNVEANTTTTTTATTTETHNTTETNDTTNIEVNTTNVDENTTTNVEENTTTNVENTTTNTTETTTTETTTNTTTYASALSSRIPINLLTPLLAKVMPMPLAQMVSALLVCVVLFGLVVVVPTWWVYGSARSALTAVTSVVWWPVSGVVGFAASGWGGLGATYAALAGSWAANTTGPGTASDELPHVADSSADADFVMDLGDPRLADVSLFQTQLGLAEKQNQLLLQGSSKRRAGHKDADIIKQIAALEKSVSDARGHGKLAADAAPSAMKDFTDLRDAVIAIVKKELDGSGELIDKARDLKSTLARSRMYWLPSWQKVLSCFGRGERNPQTPMQQAIKVGDDFLKLLMRGINQRKELQTVYRIPKAGSSSQSDSPNAKQSTHQATLIQEACSADGLISKAINDGRGEKQEDDVADDNAPPSATKSAIINREDYKLLLGIRASTHFTCRWSNEVQKRQGEILDKVGKESDGIDEVGRKVGGLQGRLHAQGGGGVKLSQEDWTKLESYFSQLEAEMRDFMTSLKETWKELYG